MKKNIALRELIEGKKGIDKKITKPVLIKDKKGTVLERIRKKELEKKRLNEINNNIIQDSDKRKKRILEIEQIVQDILLENRNDVFSERKLVQLVIDSMKGNVHFNNNNPEEDIITEAVHNVIIIKKNKKIL
jgi:hypothetical protein